MRKRKGFDDWLSSFAKKSKDPVVRASQERIRYFFNLYDRMPSRYGWRHTPLKAFKAQAAKLRSAEEFNRLYWNDVARQIEAYAVMVVWRADEILEPAVASLNQRQVLTPAILGRALLELASTVIIHSNNLCKTIEDTLRDPQSTKANTVVVCHELEEYLVKMIFGTRIGKPPDYLTQTRVGTYIKRLSQNPNAADLPKIYDYLCDLTHPNMLGNARFWAAVERRYPDGSELVRMERFAESKNVTDVREKVLWSLGWSAACICNGFQMCQEATAAILLRWPTRSEAVRKSIN